MFDAWLEESLGSPSALLHLASDTMIAERLAGCRRLRVAAAWADCHGPSDDLLLDRSSALVEEYVQLGGHDTPLVSSDCAAELGLALEIGVQAARRLIADALTLRHRLPSLWRRVVAGEVWAWKAAKIAQRTRHLRVLPSLAVDRHVTPLVEQLAWNRLLDVLEATLLRADERTYQRRADEAAALREVRSYRGEHGLRILVARAESGDVLAFEALVDRVAQCLAEEGDEDGVGVRRSKALGIIAHQAKLRHLLARHAGDADDPRRPEERVAAHLADPTDPWAADDLPAAGWETARHGNVHDPVAGPSPDRTTAHEPDHRGACTGCGSTFDLTPLTPAELRASRIRAVVHVHVTDQTLIDQRGVLRTADGPITLDQFRRWLTDADPAITLRPVLDPASVAAVDSYEIPRTVRRAVQIRQPASVWPFSTATSVTTGGRLDLDHTRRYVTGGPPGQTSIDNLGPLSRAEHQAKTRGGWQGRQPDLGTYVWRSPHGWISVVTNHGSLVLGDGPWAHRVWRAAQPRLRTALAGDSMGA